MIRIDAIWLATEPMDMRSGTEKALARVVPVFGAAQPHSAYLFASSRQSHEGVGSRRIGRLVGGERSEPREIFLAELIGMATQWS